MDIAFVMAARNAAGTIGEAIAAILAQDDPTWTLVVVDDASDDGTEEVAAEYQDARIKVVRSPSRLGRGGARNLAVATSKSDAIIIADADDRSKPWRVSLSKRLFESPDVLLVAGQQEDFGAWGGPVRRFDFPTKPEDVLRRLERKRMPISHCAMAMRTTLFNAVGGYPTIFERCEDYAMLNLSFRGPLAGGRRVLVSDRTLVEYRTYAQWPWWYWRENAIAQRKVDRWLAGAVAESGDGVATVPYDCARWVYDKVRRRVRRRVTLG